MTNPFVVAFSGPLCAGKSTAARELGDLLAVPTLSARALIAALAGSGEKPLTREQLQAYGERLERETGGKWIAAGVRASTISAQGVVVDAVRTPNQAAALKGAFGERLRLVHLTCSLEERRQRFVKREDVADAGRSYDAVAAHPTEVGAESVVPIADLMVDTSGLTPDDVLKLVVADVKTWRDQLRDSSS